MHSGVDQGTSRLGTVGEKHNGSSDDRVPGWRAIVRAGWALIILPVALYVWSLLKLESWLVDDAGITFAYARSAADGYGLVQQPGLPAVEGYSNPLWLALLVIAKLLGVFDSGATIAGVPDYVWLPKLLAVLCHTGTLSVIYWSSRSLMQPLVAGGTSILAGAFLASLPSYVVWTASGLENSLYGLLVTALTAVLLRAAATHELFHVRTASRCAMLAFACALTRPDGMIYVAAYPIAVAASVGSVRAWPPVRRAAFIWVLLTLVAFGSFLLSRYWIFGEWLPNTAIAKAQGAPTLQSLARVSDLLSYVGWSLSLLGAALLGAILLSSAERHDQVRFRAATAVAAVSLFLAGIAYAVLNPDWMGELRFATPVWTTGAFLLSVTSVGVLTNSTLSVPVRMLLGLSLAVSWLVNAPDMRDRLAAFARSPTVPLCQVVHEYSFFNLYGESLGVPQGTLVLPDVGGASLTSRYRLVDSAGLTDVAIARALRAGDTAAIHDYLLSKVKPEFIHRHGVYLPSIIEDSRFRANYVEIVTGRDYVRKDIVAGREAALETLRADAVSLAQAAQAWLLERPLDSCGERLVPGTLPNVAEIAPR